MLTLPPLSLYVHIPWCVQKCPYCDFNSHGQNGELPQQEYVDALIADLNHDLRYVQGRKLHSIFIGGGTPSLFHAAQIKRLLDYVSQIIPFKESIEITMEANPGTLEHDDFEAYYHAGITRLSIGVQSFSSDKLNLLGRIHDENEAKVAARKALNTGYQSFNLDLMHGLPNQSFDEAMADIDTAAALSPPHLSWYQLTIEQNTLFHSRPPQLPDDEALWEIYEQGQKKLAALGYEQYEISAYAKPGFQCQHNINYWQFGDYLGIGCGAHGKVTLLGENKILRTVKIKHPKGYLTADDYNFETTEVIMEDRALEYLMNRFRLMSPIPKTEFEQRTGLSRDVLIPGINASKKKLLLTESVDHWELTAKGKLFVNELLSQFC
ncbi:radical SAM family heme chaperone HemW [Shewanella sp. D64]|uniref:radical SAM family heme chaperone HemW n=1 Tax=unclassified Shewanella TaxID=196818 RepID=UPI0022BA389D|nr:MULTISPECIES: radical SAM family heme chaperone HemW [unclassified Shewanella]MEC4728231.1 radical SAM family heme chaperone HemW [Shewanella sp. D64]MEC4739315.1 radical SAM family heme chaperone HemW [Shewanella sp. E94]WBJ97026.1 radical SAM family heme chaperone HemW [Shewanella sp. MTB7]